MGQPPGGHRLFWAPLRSLSVPPSRSEPKALLQPLSRFGIRTLPSTPFKLSSEECPWRSENPRWGGSDAPRVRPCAAPPPARPLPHLGLPLFPAQGTGASGGSLGLRERVSLRGPGGGGRALRAAQGWRGRARAGAAGARRPRLHNKAPAPVTSHRPGPADGWGTRAQRPLPLPSPPGRRRAGAGPPPGSLHALGAFRASAIREPRKDRLGGLGFPSALGPLTFCEVKGHG